MVRILILEDDPVMITRTTTIMSDWKKSSSLTTAACVAEALEQIEAHPFDLLIANLNLPDGSDIDAIRRFVGRNPKGHAIVLSSLMSGEDVVDAIRGGATGYLLKDDDAIGIRDGVEAIMDGKSPISASVAHHIITAIQRDEEAPRPTPDKPRANAPRLTPRELDVLHSIARGFTYNEIAEIQGISPKTVPVHIRNIYRKLAASNRSEAVFEARFHGLI